MRSIALFTIFITAFLITANIHIYVQSLRLFIYAWHIFVPVIPLHIILAITMGVLLKPDRATTLYYVWWGCFLFVIGLSVVFVAGERGAISEAVKYVTVGGIGVSFLAVVQNRALAIAGALGIACATLLAAGVSFAEFLNPDFTMIVDQRYEYDSIREGVISRTGGLHINANSNARIMALGMFVSCFFLQRNFRFVFCLIVGAAVFTTVSRSGMITWALAMVLLTALGQFSGGRLLAKVLGFSVVALLAVLLTTGKVPTLIAALGLEEFMSEQMVERVSEGFLAQEDGSTSSRKDLAHLAIELYADNPILGAGLGSSSALGDVGLGSHNTLLQIAAELGTVGFITTLGLFLVPLILKSENGFCFMVLFCVSSMFAHSLINKVTLSFILPAGLVLLSKLDQPVPRLSKASSRRRKRKRSRSGSNNRHVSARV